MEFAVEGDKRDLDVGEVGGEVEVGVELTVSFPGGGLEAHLHQLHRLPSLDHCRLERPKLKVLFRLLWHLHRMDNNRHSELVGYFDRAGRRYNISMARVLWVGIVGQQEASSSDVPVQAAFQHGGRPGNCHLVLRVARLEEKLAGMDALRRCHAWVKSYPRDSHWTEGVGSNLEIKLQASKYQIGNLSALCLTTPVPKVSAKIFDEYSVAH